MLKNSGKCLLSKYVIINKIGEICKVYNEKYIKRSEKMSIIKLIVSKHKLDKVKESFKESVAAVKKKQFSIRQQIRLFTKSTQRMC